MNIRAEYTEQKRSLLAEESEDREFSSNSYFAPTETTASQPIVEADTVAAVTAAIENSERFDGTQFFANRRARRVEMTGTAYVLFQALQAGGDPAFEMAVGRIPPGLRLRAPSRAKLELLAIQLTVKPQSTEERKSCSAYASLLIVAQAYGITTECYSLWANKIDLADAEVQARNIRRALKASASECFKKDQGFTKPIYELQVAVLVDGKQKDFVRLLIEDTQVGQVRTLIAQAKVTGELTDFASDITDTSAVSVDN